MEQFEEFMHAAAESRSCISGLRAAARSHGLHVEQSRAAIRESWRAVQAAGRLYPLPPVFGDVRD